MITDYPSGFSVEPALLEDLTSVQAILNNRCRWLAQRHIKQWPGGGFPQEVIQKSIESDGTYLARVGKEIVGTFSLTDADSSWGEFPGVALYVRRMATHSSWGGRDIGGAMLSWISNQAARDARTSVRLSCVVNEGALVRYFEKTGFEQMATVEIDGVLSALMERPAGM